MLRKRWCSRRSCPRSMPQRSWKPTSQALTCEAAALTTFSLTCRCAGPPLTKCMWWLTAFPSPTPKRGTTAPYCLFLLKQFKRLRFCPAAAPTATDPLPLPAWLNSAPWMRAVGVGTPALRLEPLDTQGQPEGFRCAAPIGLGRGWTSPTPPLTEPRPTPTLPLGRPT